MKKGAIFSLNTASNEKESISYYFSNVRGGEKDKVIIFHQDIVESSPKWFEPLNKKDIKGAWYE